MSGVYFFLSKLVRRVMLDWWRLAVPAPPSTSPQLSLFPLYNGHRSKGFETRVAGRPDTLSSQQGTPLPPVRMQLWGGTLRQVVVAGLALSMHLIPLHAATFAKPLVCTEDLFTIAERSE